MSYVMDNSATLSLTQNGYFGVKPVCNVEISNLEGYLSGVSLPIYFENDDEVESFLDELEKLYDVDEIEDNDDRIQVTVVLDSTKKYLEKPSTMWQHLARNILGKPIEIKTRKYANIILYAEPRQIFYDLLHHKETANCIQILVDDPSEFERSLIDNIIATSSLRKQLTHYWQKTDISCDSDEKASERISKLTPLAFKYIAAPESNQSSSSPQS